MQEKNTIGLKMSFKDYYSLVDTIKVDLRYKIMAALEISEKTFYNKLNSDNWTALEREKIDQIFTSHISDLNKHLNYDA